MLHKRRLIQPGLQLSGERHTTKSDDHDPGKSYVNNLDNYTHKGIALYKDIVPKLL